MHPPFAISDPNAALFCVVLGMLSIYIEFCLPGRVLPGALGSVSLIVGLAGFATFPLDWRGLVLALGGFALALTGRKLLTAASAIVMPWGWIALNPRIVPAVAFGLAIPLALATGFLFSIAIRARRNKTVGMTIS